MNSLKDIVSKAKMRFRVLLEGIASDGGLTPERYHRFLSMQYHLTKGVQRHFMIIASDSSLAHRKSLRRFLVEFANEEELHYLIAEKDLENLGEKPLPCNLDTRLWWSFFDSVVQKQPFIRLGATCVLENISVGSGDLIKGLIANADYLNPRNTRFLIIHQHEDLPHGDQIFEALDAAKLEPWHFEQLEEGAKIATELYLRMFAWALCGDDSSIKRSA